MAAAESTSGFLFCHDCGDFVYDPAFEEIRSGSKRKRKHIEAPSEKDQKLISQNTGATSCAATGLRGLYNMGQTCFMSVILQSLIHNPLVRTYYLGEGHKSGDCDKDACTSCALDDIYTDFYGQEKHEGYGAVHMLQGCWKHGGGLAGYSQQDAHEYLGFILNSLHTAISPKGDDRPDSGEGTSKSCNCMVHQTFGGLLKSTVTCCKCMNTTTAVDPFMDLSLDIRNSNISIKKKKLILTNGTQTTKEIAPMDLGECLDRFTAVETLSSDSYTCRQCASSQEARKCLSLSRLPLVVPIHLKRFSHNKNSATSSKVETKIHFPFTLDLARYTKSSGSVAKKINDTGLHIEGEGDASHSASDEKGVVALYELSSVVVHKGKIDNGHYISYTRQGDEWFRFDDSMVVQVDEKEVLGAEAYMLFYVTRAFDVA